MPDDPATKELLDQRYVLVVLCLVVNEEGEMQYGEALTPAGDLLAKFRHLNDLPALLTTWLESPEV